MNTLVMSMKRLYESGSITKAAVAQRVRTGKITEEDYEYITGETYKA